MHRDEVYISVVVPAYNNPKDLRECLVALLADTSSGSEIIVVDDASTDSTASVAREMGVGVLQLEKNSGPAAARNYGAKHARGLILFFVDADVIIAPQALGRVEGVFREQPDLAAVFGSYDARPRAKGTISQYRNLLHHFVHQNGHPDASTFWAGCGAIRRSIFDSIGGFDEKKFSRPSIEDIELGYRLRQAGYRILLDKELQVTHLKRWNLFSLIRTDITCRAVPWSRLMLETKNAPGDLNLKSDQKLSVALMGLACLLLALAVFQPLSLAGSIAAVLGVLVINRKLYFFFFRQQGFFFAAASTLLHLLYYIYSGLSYLYAWAEFQFKRATPIASPISPKH
jgi:glycosyltransferase involved in cell wall biosynthesis